MTPQKTKQVIEQRLGKPLDDVFAWIDLESPLGSASIAQVCERPLTLGMVLIIGAFEHEHARMECVIIVASHLPRSLRVCCNEYLIWMPQLARSSAL